MDIYIKPVKKAQLTQNGPVYIKDVAEVIATKDVADAVNGIKLMDITAVKTYYYLISITDIIRLIKQKYPDATINNVGETDTLVAYGPTHGHTNKLFKLGKIIFVCLVLFVGSAMAIMSFYSDAQIWEVFKTAHRIIFNKENSNPLILEIPYAIGLAAGIILFFNHLLGKKITADLTPIEVQISVYETQVSDSFIDILDSKSKKTEEAQAKQKEGGAGGGH